MMMKYAMLLNVNENLPHILVNNLTRNSRRWPVARRIYRLHLLYPFPFYCLPLCEASHNATYSATCFIVWKVNSITNVAQIHLTFSNQSNEIGFHSFRQDYSQ
jgi:hypothetical protein